MESTLKKTQPAQILGITGITFSLLAPSLPFSRWEHEFASVGHLIGYEFVWWAVIAFVLAYVAFAERRPLSSIGFRSFGLRDAGLAVLGAIVMIAGIATIYLVLFPALHVSEDHPLNQLIATPLWWRIISTVRAAIGEEVLFRGYAIERTEALTGSRVFAAVLSWVVFSVAHVGVWGWAHLLVAGFGGLVLTLLYLWRRNLWVNILTHFLVDGIAVLLA